MNKQDIRSKFLSTKRSEPEVITVDGVEMHIKRPTVKEREAIINAGSDAEIVATAMVMLVVDKDTKENIFEDADKQVLMSQEIGGAIDQFSSEILTSLLKARDEQKKQEAAS